MNRFGINGALASPYGSAGNPISSVLTGVAPRGPGMVGRAGVARPGIVGRARVGEGDGEASSGRGSSERVMVAAMRSSRYEASKPSFHRVGLTEVVEPRPDTVGPWPAGPTCEPAPRGPCTAA